MNYGYAIVRSYIIKALISTGFHCTLGINHHNEYNNFNLADDLIEPWRAMVDQLAYGIIGTAMRILVLLNPTNRYGTKMAYTELRKFLVSDGYLKLQPDVFMRMCRRHKCQ